MRQQVFERDLFAYSQCEGELPVEFGRLRPEQSRCHWRNSDGGLRRRQPPQAHRALLGDFAVRRKPLRREHIDGGNGLRPREVGSDKNVEKCFDQLA